MKAALDLLRRPWLALRRPAASTGGHLWVTFEKGGKPLARVSSASGLVRWGTRHGVELAYPVDGAGEAEELFVPVPGGARLLIRDGMTGELWAGSSLLPVDDLQPWGLVRGRGRRRGVDLTPSMAGAVEYRGVAIRFEYGPAPVVAAKVHAVPVPAQFRRPLLTREDSPFAVVAGCVYTALLLGTAFIATRELPKVVPMEAVAKRFARLVYEAPQAKTRARQEIMKKLEGQGQKVAEAKEEEKPEPEPEKPKPEPRETVKAEAPTEVPPGGGTGPGPGAPGPAVDRSAEIRKAVSGKGLLGLLGGKGTAYTSRSRGSILQGGGPVSDIDQVLSNVDGLRRAPEGGGGGTGLGAGGGRGVARGIDDAARQVASGSGKAPQLQERQDQAVQAKESNEAVESFSLKEATAAINRAVASYTGGLRYLYNKELRKNPDLEGKMTVAITIAPNGTVAEARLVDSTLKASDLEKAVLERIRKWTFPPVAPKPITVTYPFVFFPTM